MRRSVTLTSLVAASLFLAAPTCGDSLVVPATDASPPTVDIALTSDLAVALVDLDQVGVYQAALGDRLCFVPLVTDEESGAASLVWSINTIVSCVDSGGFGQSSQSLAPARQETQAGTTGDTVDETLFDEACVDATFSCRPGFTLSRAQIDVWVAGENFVGGQASATGTVLVRPPVATPGGPPPEPEPPECREGEVCCEPVESGSGCLLCVPDDAECP